MCAEVIELVRLWGLSPIGVIGWVLLIALWFQTRKAEKERNGTLSHMVEDSIESKAAITLALNGMNETLHGLAARMAVLEDRGRGR